MTDIAIESLCGIRKLSGVGHQPAGDNEAAVLVLDDVTYVFKATGDGWRTSLSEIEIVTPERGYARSSYYGGDDGLFEVLIAPVSPPLVVEVRHRDKSDKHGDGASVLYLVNERTGLVVLEVGTDNINDYYPRFIWSWQPEGWMPEWLEGKAS